MDKILQIEEDKSKVLVIDDVWANIKMIATLLSDRDVDVSYAVDGKKGIYLANNNKPDLILLDVSMPGMNGFEVCKALKGNLSTKDIPVIFLTARIQPEDIMQGFDVGAIDYITKPFSQKELLARVFTHIDLKKSQDKLKKSLHIIEQQNIDLIRKSNQLEDALAVKERIFEIVAHDLKNPFNSLIGFSEVLIEEIYEYDTNQILSFLKMIHDTANKGYSLLQNFIEWSLSQSGKLNTKQQIFDYYDILEDIINFHSSSSHNKNIEIINKIYKNTNLYADINMVSTITRNLISNALKFTNNGGQIRIEAIVSENEVEIIVSDNGVGISEEKLANIFISDVKRNSVGTSGETGTGLGLKLCKDFVEMNKGSIWVESTPSVGSRFHFKLPSTPEL